MEPPVRREAAPACAFTAALTRASGIWPYFGGGSLNTTYNPPTPRVECQTLSVNDEMGRKLSLLTMESRRNFLPKQNSDKNTTFSKVLATVSEIVRLQYTVIGNRQVES